MWYYLEVGFERDKKRSDQEVSEKGTFQGQVTKPKA